MPGFTNACIAVAGELTQRLQAVGARGLDVKHGDGCRLQGADACRFEVRWSADPSDSTEAPTLAQAPPASQRVFERPVEKPAERVFERPVEAPARAAATETLSFHDEPAPRRAPSRPLPPRPAAAPSAVAPASGGNGTADDLFEQLRSRLVEAEQQSSRHRELEAHISVLEARIGELENEVATAQDQARRSVEALVDLKRRLRELVG